MPRSAWKRAAVKKMRPAYMMPTNRLLFDIDESASIVIADTSTCSSENNVIAGSRKMLACTNARLPANIVCTSSSRIAGSQVTLTRKRNRIANLPATYSARVSGFER